MLFASCLLMIYRCNLHALRIASVAKETYLWYLSCHPMLSDGKRFGVLIRVSHPLILRYTHPVTQERWMSWKDRVSSGLQSEIRNVRGLENFSSIVPESASPFFNPKYKSLEPPDSIIEKSRPNQKEKILTPKSSIWALLSSIQ